MPILGEIQIPTICENVKYGDNLQITQDQWAKATEILNIPEFNKCEKRVNKTISITQPDSITQSASITQSENPKVQCAIQIAHLYLEEHSCLFSKNNLNLEEHETKSFKELKKNFSSPEPKKWIVALEQLNQIVLNKNFSNKCTKTHSSNCLFFELYALLGAPQNRTYLQKYLDIMGDKLNQIGIVDMNQDVHRVKTDNIAQDFLLQMMCNDRDEYIDDDVGQRKKFNPPLIVDIKHNPCRLRDHTARQMKHKIGSEPIKAFDNRLAWKVEKPKFKSYGYDLAQLIKENLSKTKIWDYFCDPVKDPLIVHLNTCKISRFDKWWAEIISKDYDPVITEYQNAFERMQINHISPVLVVPRELKGKQLTDEQASDRAMTAIDRELKIYLDLLEKIYLKNAPPGENYKYKQSFNHWKSTFVKNKKYLQDVFSRSESFVSIRDQNRATLLVMKLGLAFGLVKENEWNINAYLFKAEQDMARETWKKELENSQIDQDTLNEISHEDQLLSDETLNLELPESYLQNSFDAQIVMHIQEKLVSLIFEIRSYRGLFGDLINIKEEL